MVRNGTSLVHRFHHRQQLAALAGRVQMARLMQVIKSTNDRRAVADHPLSPKLFVEDMLLDYEKGFR